jgi:hypothetical protein
LSIAVVRECDNASTIYDDRRAEDLLMGVRSDVAPKRLRVLHIRLNLPES